MPKKSRNEMTTAKPQLTVNFLTDNPCFMSPFAGFIIIGVPLGFHTVRPLEQYYGDGLATNFAHNDADAKLAFSGKNC